MYILLKILFILWLRWTSVQVKSNYKYISTINCKELVGAALSSPQVPAQRCCHWECPPHSLCWGSSLCPGPHWPRWPHCAAGTTPSGPLRNARTRPRPGREEAGGRRRGLSSLFSGSRWPLSRQRQSVTQRGGRRYEGRVTGHVLYSFILYSLSMRHTGWPLDLPASGTGEAEPVKLKEPGGV